MCLHCKLLVAFVKHIVLQPVPFGFCRWAFTYFFVNHRRREVIFFTCSGFPSGVSDDSGDTGLGAVPLAPAQAAGSSLPSAKHGRLFDLLQASQEYEDGTWDMEGEDDDDD